MGFLDTVIKESGNEYASIVSDGVAAGDTSSFVDTGSHIFNAVVSGSLFGGIPSNKVTALAGESSTGKTFFALSVVRNFLNQHSDGGVIYFEVFPLTKSRHLLENPQQEKLSLPLALYVTFLITISTVGLFILSLSLLSQRI